MRCLLLGLLLFFSFFLSYNSLFFTTSNSFFRTGDLGFLYKGELFIVGRLRELIIIDGRNFYPSDIEEALENAIEPLRSGHVVALCVADSENPDEVFYLFLYIAVYFICTLQSIFF